MLPHNMNSIACPVFELFFHEPDGYRYLLTLSYDLCRLHVCPPSSVCIVNAYECNYPILPNNISIRYCDQLRLLCKFENILYFMEYSTSLEDQESNNLKASYFLISSWFH